METDLTPEERLQLGEEGVRCWESLSHPQQRRQVLILLRPLLQSGRYTPERLRTLVELTQPEGYRRRGRGRPQRQYLRALEEELYQVLRAYFQCQQERRHLQRLLEAWLHQEAED